MLETKNICSSHQDEEKRDGKMDGRMDGEGEEDGDAKEELSEREMCRKEGQDCMVKAATTYKSMQQLFCEDMAGRRRRRKKCPLTSTPPSPSTSPFNPLCLLQAREGLCNKAQRERQLNTLLALQANETLARYLEDKMPEKEKQERLSKILQLHASNRLKRSKKAWSDIYKEPKKCQPQPSDSLKPYELLQLAYRGKATPAPPLKATPSSLTKGVSYNTMHEAKDRLDFRLRALYNAGVHFNASEAVVCGQHLTSFLHRPCAKANKCGCCSCDCNVRVGAGYSKDTKCICPRKPCFPKKAAACLCNKGLTFCDRRDDDTSIRVTWSQRREHPCSVKKAIEGPHTRMANDGYARIKESGIRFNS